MCVLYQYEDGGMRALPYGPGRSLRSLARPIPVPNALPRWSVA